jgi:hypothetical protein
LSFGFLFKENITLVLDDITTKYPSKTNCALLLRWPHKPCWKCRKGGDSLHIPRLDNDTIYGVIWTVMFNQIASLKKSSESIVSEESPHKLCRLKSIGFCFTYNKFVSLHESKWMKTFKQAKAFYNKNGHCLSLHQVMKILKDLFLGSKKQGNELK